MANEAEERRVLPVENVLRMEEFTRSSCTTKHTGIEWDVSLKWVLAGCALAYSIFGCLHLS